MVFSATVLPSILYVFLCKPELMTEGKSDAKILPALECQTLCNKLCVFKSWGLLNNVYIGPWGCVLRHSRAIRPERRPSGKGKLRKTGDTWSPGSLQTLAPAFLCDQHPGFWVPRKWSSSWAIIYSVQTVPFCLPAVRLWPAGTRTLPLSQRFLAEIPIHYFIALAD